MRTYLKGDKTIMDMDNPKFWEVFMELFDDMPRFGPGSDHSMKKVLAMVPELPEKSLIADLGAGNGIATFQLAEFFRHAKIVVVDNHGPFMDGFNQKAKELGLDNRLKGVAGDMIEPPLETHSADMIISEGAIYNVGFEKGMRAWRHYLKEDGLVVVSEAVWLISNPPDEIKAMWESEYPAITSIDSNLELIELAGYECLDHFTLPRSDWWDEYYVPMQKRVSVMQKKYEKDDEALDVMNYFEHEIEMFEKYGDTYGYEFFVCKKK